MIGAAPSSSLEIGTLVTQLGGGLALFLFGMRQMTEALKVVAGGGMKNLLARLTTNRFTAAGAGAIVTAVIQSSSVTTVLVVGFVSAGLLSLSQSIGVILGANVGTTITAQIIAFQVYKYGLLLIGVGFFTEILARRDNIRQWGSVVMGLGLIFFGMELMSIATGPLRSWDPFIGLMRDMGNPWLAVAIGALFTAIVQSSSATTGIVIVFASQGFITLESGIGLIFGSNIGTCVTAFISAFGRPREALQVAWVHVLFNVSGVLLWLAFIPQFADVIRAASPVSEDLTGMARVAADTPRQIANAHTLFNIANLLLFVWFTGPLGRLVERIVPPRPLPLGMQPKYLDEFFLEQPALALDQVRRELVRLGELVRNMLRQSLRVAASGGQGDVSALIRADDDIDSLYEHLIRYLGRLSQKDLIHLQPELLGHFIGISNYLENMGDVIQKELLPAASKRIAHGSTISESTLEKLTRVHEQVCSAYDKALSALGKGDAQDAMDAIESKAEVNDLAEDAAAHIAKRLVAEEPYRLENFQVETDFIESYKRLNTFTRRIARLVLAAGPAAGAGATETGADVQGQASG